jgi:hypothetical protein
MQEKQTTEDSIWLEEWSGQEVPDEFLELTPSSQKAIRRFVEEVYESKIKSVKKAIMANELTLKFIPNFITIQILKSFIEPEMAALIGETLPLSLTLPIIKGLDPEYLAESGLYLNAARAAEIFIQLDSYKMKKIFQIILHRKPMKILDIYHHISESKQSLLPKIDKNIFESIHLTETRKQILNKFAQG